MKKVTLNAPYAITVRRKDNNENITFEPGVEIEVDDETAGFLENFRPSGAANEEGNSLEKSELQDIAVISTVVVPDVDGDIVTP